MDVSKLWIDITVTMITKRFDQYAASMKALGKWLKKHQVTFDENSLLVIENNGVYHRLVWEYCSTQGLPLYIGNA
jgi:transposase